MSLENNTQGDFSHFLLYICMLVVYTSLQKKKGVSLFQKFNDKKFTTSFFKGHFEVDKKLFILEMSSRLIYVL